MRLLPHHLLLVRTARLFIVLLAALVFHAAHGQAQVLWLETNHDYGTFYEQDGKVSCSMRVVNVGDSALIIKRVKTSCGCTAGEFTRTPIAPGDTGIVTLTYNPANRPGEFEKDAFVYTTGTTARSLLRIKGNVIPKPETLDEQFPVVVGALRYNGSTLPLGEVPRGRGRMTYMSGYNASTDTVVITTHHVPEHLSVTAVPDSVPPGMVSTVTIYFDSKKAPLWGLNSDTFTLMTEPIAADDEAVSGFTQVDVMAVVTEDFTTLTPRERERAPRAMVSCVDRLNFEPAARGSTMTQTFVVANTGHDKLMLRRLWTGSAGITATAHRNVIKRGQQAIVTVSVDTNVYREPMLNALLTLMTNDPDAPSRTIRLVGEIN